LSDEAIAQVALKTVKTSTNRQNATHLIFFGMLVPWLVVFQEKKNIFKANVTLRAIVLAAGSSSLVFK